MSQPHQVLHVIHGKVFSGAERVLMMLCSHFDRALVAPQVVCLDDGLLRQKLEAIDVPVTIIKMRHRADMSVIGRLRDHLRQHRIDLVHTHSGRTNLLGRIAASLARKPVVTTVHAPIARDSNSLNKKSLNAMIDRATSPLAARHISVSDDVHTTMVAEGYAAHKVVTIHNGIDSRTLEEQAQAPDPLPGLGLNERDFVVGTVAQFRPRKGAEYLIRALALIPDDRVKVLFIGSGDWVDGEDYMQTLKSLAAELGLLDRRAIFTGFRDDVAAFMARLDLFVLPSLFGEGTPMSILEAMALRRPVIATASEGNREVVVDGETGLLVPTADPATLAAAIQRLAADRELAAKMGAAGRLRLEAQYTAERMAQRYTELYREVLSGR
jgi:glycosyltransferase involved in cell wall biosynthesis